MKTKNYYFEGSVKRCLWNNNIYDKLIERNPKYE